MPKAVKKEKQMIVSGNLYEQRFHMLMKLIRIDRMLKGARIIEAKPR